MEVTSVSPSVTSPTEGDDLCEIDGSNVAIHSVTLLISLCGLAGNGAVLWLLRLKLRNAGFHLALVDFLFLLFAIPSALLFLVEEVSCSPILPLLYLSFLYKLSLVSYYWAMIRLLFTRSVVYMHRLCNLCCHCSLTKSLRWGMYSVQILAFLALFILIRAATSWCSPQQQVHCRAALLSMYIVIGLLLVAPMVISFTSDLIKASCGSRKQAPKRRDIIVFIMVLLIPVLSLFNLREYAGFPFVPSAVVFLLNCIYNSIKPFIYFLVGMGWRPCSVGSFQLSLQRIFDEPEENTAHSNDATAQTLV